MHHDSYITHFLLREMLYLTYIYVAGSERDWPAAQHQEQIKLFAAHQTFNTIFWASFEIQIIASRHSR